MEIIDLSLPIDDTLVETYDESRRNILGSLKLSFMRRKKVGIGQKFLPSQAALPKEKHLKNYSKIFMKL